MTQTGVLQNLQLAPGIVNEFSDTAAGARWIDGNRVRFYKAQPQPIGGWLADSLIESAGGAVRGAQDWVALDAREVIAIGTPRKLQILLGGTYFDITPVVSSSTLGSDPFTTASGDTEIEVSHTAHGVSPGDTIIFSGATTFNGVDMDGEWIVATVIDTNSYTIQYPTAASGTGSGGGAAVNYEALYPAGPTDTAFGYGWGAGPWGLGPWGQPNPGGGIRIPPRTWALSTWGEDLLANPRGGPIFHWDYSSGTGTRAAALSGTSGAPDRVEFIHVSPTTRHLLAFGCTPYGGAVQDPMHFRWATQNDFNGTGAWVPAEDNTAGDQQLDHGSRILSSIETANNEILIFTDTATYGTIYTGPPFIFSTRLLGTSSGIIAPHAAATFGGMVWWMGPEGFFFYDGRVQSLPCDVHTYVFENLNKPQREKISCGVNSIWKEIWWFYPDETSQENNRYVAYNWETGEWHIGALSRTFWLDRGESVKSPVAWDPSGQIFNHELPDRPISNAFIQSGEIQLQDGDWFAFVDRIIPDFERLSGTVNFSLSARPYPASPPRVKGPYSVTSTTPRVDLRHRGRSFSIRLDSSNAIWRMSSVRVRVKPDGQR